MTTGTPWDSLDRLGSSDSTIAFRPARKASAPRRTELCATRLSLVLLAFALPLASRLVLATCLVALLDGHDARGADAFEIQVYDGRANPPGVPGLELHANDALSGLKSAPPPEIPPHHLVHLTLEPSLGLTRFWEIGAYLQTAVRPDNGFDFAGAKLRSKFVTPPDWRAHLRLGCNVEIAYLPPRYEKQRWGTELRPIVAWESDHWLFAANPIVSVPLTQAAATFEPAAMALFKIPEKVSFGIEYYADLGAFVGAGADSAGPQEHLLFEVVNLLGVGDVELNIGLGEGLTAGSSRLVAKLVAGYSFDRPARHN